MRGVSVWEKYYQVLEFSIFLLNNFSIKYFILQDTLGSRIGFSFRDGDKESGNADCPANNTFVVSIVVPIYV